jgi:hypothetical protein
VFWAEVLRVIDEPVSSRSGGLDDKGREKWLVEGMIERVGKAELVVAIDTLADGTVSVFFTVYWQAGRGGEHG